MIFSDIREDNIDLFLVLDKSLSMIEEIDAVKEYVGDFLIDSFLIKGDNLLLINFYGEAVTLIQTSIKDNVIKDRILSDVEAIIADGRWTDIGNALDLLNKEVNRFPSENRRKYLLLITDGIQEAPPESKYWSDDGGFNHEFLENTRIIQKNGWKIQIIGIGSATAAREIAEELSGAYAEIDNRSTDETAESALVIEAKDIDAAVGLLTGSIDSVAPPTINIRDVEGNGIFKFSVQSNGYTDFQNIKIRGLYYTDDVHEKWDLLSSLKREDDVTAFLDFTLAPDEVRDFKIPVIFPALESGDSYDGAVFMTFEGNMAITPAYFQIQLDVKSGISLWIILIIAGILILIIIVIIVIRNIAGKATNETQMIDLKCSITGKRDLIRDIKLCNNERIYIVKKGFGLDFVTSSKNEMKNALACVILKGSNLIIETLDTENFKSNKFLTGNILGKELEYLLSGKDKLSIKFNKNEK
ncbi:MAG: VWA domain-containing protein [Spirochaetales bacterium]|nr:VWA domain-containing protein [Spirochaetales bacterium]